MIVGGRLSNEGRAKAEGERSTERDAAEINMTRTSGQRSAILAASCLSL